MPFVDAHRYLKVQDQDLDDAFNSKSSRKGSHEEGVADKYSKASFESFEIEPSRFETGTPNWKKYLLPVAGLAFGVLIIVGFILFFLLVVAKNMGDPDLGFDDNGDPYLPIEDS